MVLERLTGWYQAQCNGDWEHQYGVRIETLDNPGWLVKIDLVGTSLEAARFRPVCRNTDDAGWSNSDHWLHCHVVDRMWQGAGDEDKAATNPRNIPRLGRA
jgi:hypothetical protein